MVLESIFAHVANGEAAVTAGDTDVPQRRAQKAEVEPKPERKPKIEEGPAQGDVDWSRFDIGRVVRSLSAATAENRNKILRKLHIRWWHAPTATMQRLLKHAGVDKEVIDDVPRIIDTCPHCRAWARPLPESCSRS